MSTPLLALAEDLSIVLSILNENELVFLLGENRSSLERNRPGPPKSGRQRGPKNKLTLGREKANRDAAQKVVAVLGEAVFERDAHTPHGRRQGY